MESAPKRPWYRLHWLTWMVVAVVAGAFVSRQQKKELLFGFGDLGMFAQTFTVGWPFQHAEVVVSGALSMTGPARIKPGTELTAYELFFWPLVANCAISVLFAASTAFVCERRLRHERRLQINLRQVLVAMAILGLLLTLSRPWIIGYRDVEWENFSREWSLVGIDDIKAPLRWPLLFALGCTIYSLGWLACFAVFRCWSRLRRT